ncbi:MAG: DNA polymerase III subunit chi [Alphaproteobacteria bacterium]|nr:DNA polymerase III subunit chi [Alphaproteobacteria bacterium]
MTEIGFYHLRNLTLDRALPQLLEKAYAGGYRVVLMAGSAERVDQLNALFWTYSDAAFLPHGSIKDGNAAQQPIWLTVEDENPNGADMLVLVDGATSRHLERYKRVLDVFDGNDEIAVVAARARWQQAKAAGHALTYWQQTEKGWEKGGAG